jgi:serine/threonine-protein kinase
MASTGLFLIEVLLGLEVLTLAPLLAVIAGMGFVVKGGVLSGSFYVAAAVMFLTALLMALPPVRPVGVLLFGLTTAACFFFPGLKYYRQRARADRQPEHHGGRSPQKTDQPAQPGGSK